MNIIANDCAGAYIYRDQLRCHFMNPFIWSSINIHNFCKLIEHYDDINFKNIKTELFQNNSDICKKGSMTTKIIVDDIVEICYFHYIKNDIYKNPTKVDGYTMCSDIVNYTTELYNKRIQKMTEPPIFIWDVTRQTWYNDSQLKPIEQFKNINTNYKIIIYQKQIETKTDDNIIMLTKPEKHQEVNVSASDIYKRILTTL